MPIKPKLTPGLHPSARPFVGRGDLRALFEKTLKNKKPDKHKVLVFYGVAGIGKSRLQQQLAEDLKEMWSAARSLVVDFKGGYYSSAENALRFIRSTLKSNHKVSFPTFDLAFGVYWGKSQPLIPLREESNKWWGETEWAADVAELVSGVPGFGVIVKAAQIIERRYKNFQDWYKKHGEKTLRELTDEHPSEIVDKLPMFLAMDIKNYLQEYPVPLVFFLDTYEELSIKERDDWAKELVVELPQALWVITGRERLRWAETKGEWDDHLEHHEIFGLEEEHAGKFLEKCGVDSQEIREVILRQSLEAEEKYVPFHLNAYLDFYDDILRKGQQPMANDLNVPPHEFYKLFTRHLDKDQVEAFKVLSAPRWWDDELVKLLLDRFGVKYHFTALPELYRFSFIKPGPRPQTLTMHDRMRDCLQNWLKGNKDYQQLWEKLHRFLFDHYQTQLEGIDVKSITDRHRTAITEAFFHASDYMKVDDLFSFLRTVDSLFRQAAQWAILVPLYEETIKAFEKQSDSNQVNLATTLNGLALCYKYQGRYEYVEPLYKRALYVYEETLGKEHPYVAIALNNLAGLYDAQGRYAEAEPLYLWALSIREKMLGREHTDVGQSLNNLAGLYDAQGRYAEAEPLHKRALEISEKALGKEHPDVATALNNLALLYQSQGRYAEAELLYKRALAIDEKALGKDHPDVATDLNNLALLYEATGRYAEAELMHKRALAISEKALGSDHPTVAIRLNNLAAIYRVTGRYAEAEPMYKRALAIREKALPEGHPHIGLSLNNLAELYRVTGSYAEAEPLYKRALAIHEKALGKEHPGVATALNNLALLYEATGRYPEAEPLYKRALEIDKKALGKDHPDVATALNNLAELYRVTGRYAEAEPLYKRALVIFEKALPPDHPNLATVLNNMAIFYRETGKTKEAKKYDERAREIRARRAQETGGG